MKGFVFVAVLGITVGLIFVGIEKHNSRQSATFYNRYTDELEAETALQRLEIDSLRTELKIREVHTLGR